jgi:hypothetical protein
MVSSNSPLRVGFVPEHFSTPLHFAQKHFSLSAELIPFPSGTGHMITALRAGEIDVGIGLTEGWVTGLGKADVEGDGGYKIVGTYVETPLCMPLPYTTARPAMYNLFSANAALGWAISTGAKRSINSIADLKASKIGVSRIGSGSYVMGFVLADTQGWLSSSSSSAAKKEEPFEVIPLQTFEKLRGAVNDGTADFFMWEHFTSKRYYDNGEIRRVGEIYTPWSSWMVVAATELLSAPGSGSGSGSGTGMAFDPRLEELFEKVNQGMMYFVQHQDEAVEYISTELDYSVEDAREWLKTVEFASNVRGVDLGVIQKTVDVLRKAGVLGEEGMQAQEMIGGQFGAQRPGRVHNVA